MHPTIKLFYQKQEDEKAYISSIEIPGKDTVLFDEEKGKIDFDVLSDHIGEPIILITNNEHVRSGIFTGFSNINGIKAINIEWDDETNEE